MSQADFTSARKAGFDLLLKPGVTPAAALTAVRKWEHDTAIGGAAVYVSTAITSGGFQRGASTDAEWLAAKARNEVTAGRLYLALVEGGSVLTENNGMIPTELGKVPSWSDMDYMSFYLSYATGLSDDASVVFVDRFADHTPQAVLGVANNRALTNDERWPSYLEAISLMLECLDEARRPPGSVSRRTLGVLMQLVDTGYSLGCRAEEVFAQHEHLDILVPAIDAKRLPSELTKDVSDLAALDAICGRSTSPAMPVPKVLNSTRVDV